MPPAINAITGHKNSVRKFIIFNPIMHAQNSYFCSEYSIK
ncbi:hypothetical protein B194_0830 [Serratia plymuthica A30]|nr:hypothetical protein B194_0830 [Serratia plymuthica A30]